MASEVCSLCFKDLNPHDLGIWKEVKGWVGGPKKDSMRMREDTGKFAHNHCVEKIQAGQTLDQPSMFEEPEGSSDPQFLPEGVLPDAMMDRFDD